MSLPVHSKMSSCWVVIPAAGVGARMRQTGIHTDLPKQYLSLAGKPCLQHVIDTFLGMQEVKGICVALSPTDALFMQFVAPDQRIFTTAGGAERSSSVLNGLRFIAHSGAGESDWVLVHDAARPCVSVLHIQTLLQTCEQKNVAGLLAVPVTDTIKRQTTNRLVEQTVDRQSLWQAHTPQCARLGALRSAMEIAQRQKLNITDEASALEAAGEDVVLVEDSRDNIKITRPEDVWLAEQILERQAV